MKIRHSQMGDLPRIMEIYAYARAFMAAHGNPRQWGPTQWPPEVLIRQDIEAGHSYVCVNDADRVIGTFFFIQGRDIEPTYREITDGAWLDDSPYGVVHRIAGDGSEKGIGAYCLNWAYEQCGHLRIDTHGHNAVMQGLLKKLGFVRCGTIYVEEDDDPRLAYEKSGNKGAISLCFMTRELCHQFFREYKSDPAVYEDESSFQPYVYSKEAADRFYDRKQVPGRLELVAMMDGRTIGQVQLKNIDEGKRECEFGFHMQNDSVKGLGYGTQIARLALEYAFANLEVDAVCAYTLLRNTRSQHVLEKVGFRYIDEKDGFKRYWYVR